MQAIWKGAVNFGLVNVPVKMFTATHDHDIPLKMLHKKYNEPIQYHRTCPHCEEDVNWKDIVKAYEYEPGHYVTFDKKELEQIGSESSREINLLDFVDLEAIDPIYFQKTYYLAPGETGSKAYNLLVQALEATRKIGIANVTLRAKSSLAAIRVIDGVLSMVTLFYAEEIRPKTEIPNLPKREKVSDRELDMAKMLIEQLSADFEPEQYEDEYRQRLLNAIEDKVKGKEIKAKPEEKKQNVIDLMDALQSSLKQVKASHPTDKGSTAKKPAKPKSRPKAKTKRTGS